MKKKISFLKRLQGVIPGGSHTYSKGHDQFSSNAPVIINKGKGAYLFDHLGQRYGPSLLFNFQNGRLGQPQFPHNGN